MDPKLIAVFAKEENMIGEYDSHHAVEFKYAMDASDQEASERVEFFQVIYDQFGGGEIVGVGNERDVVVGAQCMKSLRNIKFVEVFRRPFVCFVCLIYTYDAADH